MGLGYFGGRWLGSTWFGTAVSVLALFVAGALAAFVVKRPATRTATPAGIAAEAAKTPVPAQTDTVAETRAGAGTGAGTVTGAGAPAVAPTGPGGPAAVGAPAPAAP